MLDFTTSHNLLRAFYAPIAQGAAEFQLRPHTHSTRQADPSDQASSHIVIAFGSPSLAPGSAPTSMSTRTASSSHLRTAPAQGHLAFSDDMHTVHRKHQKNIACQFSSMKKMRFTLVKIPAWRKPCDVDCGEEQALIIRHCPRALRASTCDAQSQLSLEMLYVYLGSDEV